MSRLCDRRPWPSVVGLVMVLIFSSIVFITIIEPLFLMRAREIDEAAALIQA